MAVVTDNFSNTLSLIKYNKLTNGKLQWYWW